MNFGLIIVVVCAQLPRVEYYRPARIPTLSAVEMGACVLSRSDASLQPATDTTAVRFFIHVFRYIYIYIFFLPHFLLYFVFFCPSSPPNAALWLRRIRVLRDQIRTTIRPQPSYNIRLRTNSCFLVDILTPRSILTAACLPQTKINERVRLKCSKCFDLPLVTRLSYIEHL